MKARIYDAINGKLDRAGFASHRRRLVAELGGEVLEVGAGTGLNLAHYRRADRVTALEPDASYLATWQDRLTPLQRRLADGCHLNRDLASAIGRGGFHIDRLERFRMPAGHPLIRTAIQGSATRREEEGGTSRCDRGAHAGGEEPNHDP